MNSCTAPRPVLYDVGKAVSCFYVCECVALLTVVFMNYDAASFNSLEM